MSSLAHFTGVLYTPVWVLTLSVYLLWLWKASNSEQTEVKHPRSFLCSREKVIIQVGCLPVRNLSADVPGST